MQEWEPIKLGDCCSKIGSGATPRGGANVYLSHGEMAFIRSQNIYNEKFLDDGIAYLTAAAAKALDNVTVQERDILINITGDSVARTCIVPSRILPARVNQHVAIIRPNNHIFDPAYLRYYFIADGMQKYLLVLASAGGTRNALTKSMLENLLIPRPPLDVQKQAVKILASVDDKIELNAQINRNLEAQARAIFKSWFIDFEPFRDGEFVDSELGPIPKGWNRGVLADIVDFCKQRIRVSELSPTTYISTENMLPNRGGIVDASSLPSVEYVTAFQKNDVLVSNIRPYFKKIWYCAFFGGCSNDVLCFSAKKTIPSEYTYSILNDEIFFAYVTAGSKGTKMPRGDKSQIMAYPVILPADSALKKFSEQIRPMIAQIRINEKESQYLSELRDTLLPKLMSGEIDVSAVEV